MSSLSWRLRQELRTKTGANIYPSDLMASPGVEVLRTLKFNRRGEWVVTLPNGKEVDGRKLFTGLSIPEALNIDDKTWQKFIRLNKQYCIDEAQVPRDDWPANYAPSELLPKNDRGYYEIEAWQLVYLRSYMDGDRSGWGRPPQPKDPKTKKFMAWTPEALRAWLARRG